MTQPRAMLKCSKCNHIFPAPGSAPAPGPEVEPDAEEPTVATDPAPAPRPRLPAVRKPAEKNLSFEFDRETEDWTADEAAPLEIPESAFEAQRPGRKPRATPPRPPRRRIVEDEPTLFDGEAADEDDAFEDEEPSRGSRGNRAPGVRVAPVLVFLMLVVAGYFALMIALLGNPDWAQEIAQRMPFVGSGNRDRLLSRKVVLLKVQGAYERTKEGKDIFIITGEASNHAAVPLSSVQVLARILAGDAQPIDERVIFCGSSIPVRLLHDLSLGELSVIGRLKPPKTFLVRPGERAEFMVVFTDLPKVVTEFTTQVVVAQRQA